MKAGKCADDYRMTPWHKKTEAYAPAPEPVETEEAPEEITNQELGGSD